LIYKDQQQKLSVQL